MPPLDNLNPHPPQIRSSDLFQTVHPSPPKSPGSRHKSSAAARLAAMRLRLAADFAFFAQGLHSGCSIPNLLHGYIYARWPYLYISFGAGEHPLYKRVYRPLRDMWPRSRGERAESDMHSSLMISPPGVNASSHTIADGYHGKVISTAAARRLVRIEQSIALPDLEQVIPYPRARALILDHPTALAVIECPCRVSRPHPCLPLDVCLIVGDPFVSLVVARHPARARRITADEADRILEETEARGNVHHAFFKDALFGRFYAICNCCSCCCGAMQMHRSGTPMLASSGFVSRLNTGLCRACGRCAAACSFGALHLSTPEETAGRRCTMTVEAEVCMGCGVCVTRCPQHALSLELAPWRGLPLDISRQIC